ncbi:T9SS type A sorting domain-containing protein [Crocinitomix algicola]|uniref:T9SS type A sorting domain-containing protein n=1 Tax=Crocinitomix algicola TaxID=1740263 RepID=UPI00087303FF|nr:T9SS type A sorting domain-containing protein [Crocinitomix algicola]
MKSKIYSLFLFVLLFSTQETNSAYGQCTITVESTDDYEVNIEITMTGIDAPASCTWGYNYNVELDYSVTITGPDAPGSLWTLQGNIGCNSDNNFFSLPNSGGTGSLTTGSNPWRGSSDCAIATPEQLGCDVARIQIYGPGIPNQVIECTFGSPLPIELISFKATPENNWINLEWITGSELNNDFFTIEHSTDGINWEKIEEIKGAGNSNKRISYSTYDYNSVYGTNYYRLKQTDYDGKFEYSDIQAVNLNSSNGSFMVYPNPANSIITLSSEDNINHIEVYSALGELVMIQDFNGYSSQNRIDISSLENGLYIIKTNIGSQKFTKN